jgi:hypothetical protein
MPLLSSEPLAQSSGDTPKGPLCPPCPLFLEPSSLNNHESQLRSKTTLAQCSVLSPHVASSGTFSNHVTLYLYHPTLWPIYTSLLCDLSHVMIPVTQTLWPLTCCDLDCHWLIHHAYYMLTIPLTCQWLVPTWFNSCTIKTAMYHS